MSVYLLKVNYISIEALLDIDIGTFDLQLNITENRNNSKSIFVT